MARRPNILLIVSDQHSPHVLGCAGDPVVRTPALDQLAARGVRFTDTSCASPLCVPSRMTFLTSRTCSDIEVWTNACRLRSDIATFVHHVVKAGYESVLCGRMHFVGPDQRHGYERRIIGDVHAHLEHISRATCGQTAEGITGWSGPGRTAYECYDEAVTQTAAQFLRERSGQPGERPFFLTVGYVLPHCPYIAPKRLYDEYHDAVDVPEVTPEYLAGLHPALQQWHQHRATQSIPAADRRAARAAYYGLVTRTDELVGDVLGALAETSFADDTIVIYLSDHGEMAGEHGMWWKSSFYQGSVGVPMIWSWPGHFAEGRTVDQVTSLLDVGPTLVDLADGEPMPCVAGRSLTGFLTGDGDVPDWPDVAFAENYARQDEPVARMVRRGPWKLNCYDGHDLPQLFNLADDPAELHDLGADPAHAAVRDELLELVHQGWSAERVESAVGRLYADRPVLSAWSQQVQRATLDPPDRWTAPDGCNVFPEE